MNPIFPFIKNQALLFSLQLPFCFFTIYILWIILSKAASKKNRYAAVNKIHFRVFLLYLAATLLIYVRANGLQLNFLISFIVGVYVYFSLHYLFIFQLIGLCKKSVSVAILDSISIIDQHGKVVTEKLLKNQMAKQGNGFEEISKDRLNQMIYLKLANTKKSKYIISTFGKIIYKMMKFLLKLYNLKRL